MSCTTNNPCFCLCTHIPPTIPCKSPTGCLKLGYLIVKPQDSVGPCNKTGEVSFKCFDFSGCCSSDIRVVVDNIDFPNKLTVNSITKDKLVFTTSNEANPGDKIKIRIKATCCDLGDYGEITIFIKDLCDCTVCETGYVCDKCTGACVTAPVVVTDITVGAGETIVYNENNIIING